MPQTETALYSRVIDINRRACHHRGLWSSYGYNAILDANLIELCLALHRRFTPPIRILDLGCGDGFALLQLSEGLVKAGANIDDFELWGMGLNRYDEMFIPDDRFIESGLNGYESDGTRFHLIVSVFTFHYMWHKLEGLEKVYNELLELGGRARLHFPGYLLRFDQSPSSLVQTEVEGNQLFSEFLAERQAAGCVDERWQYRLVPYFSDDDDCTLLAEFGHLQFDRRKSTPVAFNRSLGAFALFDKGFKFRRMNSGVLTYVASHYVESLDNSSNKRPTTTPYRITSVTSEIARRSFQLDMAVHAAVSDTVVLICPGALETLGGDGIDFAAVAQAVQDSEFAAVVRYNDPYDGGGDYAELALANFRRALAFVAESADRFCTANAPRICVMAYSSSAGAVAAVAHEYPAIDRILFVGPSFDVPRETIAPGLERFVGEVCVLIGADDEVVLPQQGFWFCQMAENASRREYVEVPGCGHAFQGHRNRSILRRAPLWAFTGIRPMDFPPPLTSPTMTD